MKVEIRHFESLIKKKLNGFYGLKFMEWGVQHVYLDIKLKNQIFICD